MGGALGDSTWIEPGDAPTVAFHVVGDPFAPYGQGIVYVPGTPPQAVIDVIGSGNVLALANQYGNNICFTPDPNNDAYTQAANSVNNGYKGLFPFHMVNPPDQSGPWEWWDSLTVVQGAALCGLNGTDIHMNALQTNPDMSKAKALAYIDTVMGYLNPRMAYCRLGAVGLEENELLESQISISPNPATEFIYISINTLDKLNTIEVFDITGRIILPVPITEKLHYTLDVSQLNTGIYFVRIQTNIGVATKKVLIR